MLNPETKFTSKLNMSISERVGTGKKDAEGNEIQENKEIAKVKLPCPTVSDFGIQGETKDRATMDKDDLEAFDPDLPIYLDDALNWLQDAISNQVKAQSRNKFVKGILRDGVTLAETFAALTAPSERSGEAMKARHDARKSFAAYLEAQNKSAVVVKVLSDLFHNESAIVTAKDQFVDALTTHMGKWIPSLSAVDAGRFERKIGGIQEQLTTRTTAMEDMK